MYAASGVGLAAPQIGRSVRIFIVDGSPFAEVEDEEPDPMAEGMEGFKVFINPIIEEESGEEWGLLKDVCLFLKSERKSFVLKKVTISYYDEEWNLKEEAMKAYAKRIIQHEYDHVDGILFTDHLSPLKDVC